MTDGDALLSAILAEPDEDAPRLVYADWLDDQEEAARAEFIRVQVELAPIRCVVDGNDPRRLRERELLYGNGCRNAAAWFDRPGFYVLDKRDAVPGPELKICTHEKPGSPRVVFEVSVDRGFINEVRLSSTAFLGGPCETCQYWAWDGTRTIEEAHSHCESCRGKKITPGLARAIFAANPVTKVVLTDKRPTGYHRDRWFWFDDRRNMSAVVNPEVYLPAAIYDRLDWEFDLTSDPPKSSLRSGQAANDALSAACVAYGRGLADLPTRFAGPPDARA